jgi:serine protease Do
LADQPLVSIADVSWILHRSPESGSLTALVKRDGAERPLVIKLPAGWRAKSDISRRVGTWPMRAMVAGGMVLVDLSDEQRTERGLGRGTMALFVKSVGQYGKHAAAKNAGFQKDDVIVALDGGSARTTEGELMGLLLGRHRPGEAVKATVLRGTERRDLSLPMQ